MSWILDECELALRGNNYSTLRLSQPDALAFEDDVLMGFVIDYRSVSDLVAGWESDQTSLLQRFSPALRAVREKGWNVYFCALSEMAPQTEDDRFAMELIEADLRNTRKVPRHSVKSAADVVAALYPLMPIQNRAKIGHDSFDDRIARHLDLAVGGAATAMFVSEAEPLVVGQAIIEAS